MGERGDVTGRQHHMPGTNVDYVALIHQQARTHQSRDISRQRWDEKGLENQRIHTPSPKLQLRIKQTRFCY